MAGVIIKNSAVPLCLSPWPFPLPLCTSPFNVDPNIQETHWTEKNRLIPRLHNMAFVCVLAGKEREAEVVWPHSKVVPG